MAQVRVEILLINGVSCSLGFLLGRAAARMLEMEKKYSQAIMFWLLPLIVIGGLFFPVLGYLVFAMMIFFLILAYFKGRFWCSHLCPRGAFLDLILSRFSLKNKLPKFFTLPAVKWSIFALFMVFFISQLALAQKNLFSLGFVFVRMCLLTTLLAIFLGIPLHHRSWCMVCPMGTLQGKIGTLRRKDSLKKGKLQNGSDQSQVHRAH